MGRDTAVSDGGTAGGILDNPGTERRVDDLRDYLDSQFSSVDQRFETMQAQLDRRFDSVEGRIDVDDEEVSKLEFCVDELQRDWP